MTNMAAEVGAFTGIVAPDAVTVDYLVRERGLPRDGGGGGCWRGSSPIPDAEYEEVIEIDASELEPMIALPGDPGNGHVHPRAGRAGQGGHRLRGELHGGQEGRHGHVRRACSARRPRPASGSHPDVRFFIQFGSQDVKRYAEARGYVDIFRAVGAEIIEPSCGACINAGPGVSYDRKTVTVSAINRNFPGRSGPGQLYLASPYTTAASALAGYITGWEPKARWSRLAEPQRPPGRGLKVVLARTAPRSVGPEAGLAVVAPRVPEHPAADARHRRRPGSARGRARPCSAGAPRVNAWR